MSVLFFFQAEDGIRDIGVTGVQTCALPISDMPNRAAPDREPPNSVLIDQRAVRVPLQPALLAGQRLLDAHLPGAVAGARSEERRVGKECRSRWSPDH